MKDRKAGKKKSLLKVAVIVFAVSFFIPAINAEAGNKVTVVTAPMSFGMSAYKQHSSERIQAAVDESARKYNSVGIQVAVIHKGKEIECFNSGFAVADEVPMSSDTKMRVASLSKPVLAMEIMKLYEEGLIDLDAPLSDYYGKTIQNPKYPEISITVDMVMRHISSITDEGEMGTYAKINEFLVNGEPYLNLSPGIEKSWRYSNFGYELLGIATEKVSGKLINDSIYEDFFEKLSIDAAFGGKQVNDKKNIAPIYDAEHMVTRDADDISKSGPKGKPGSMGNYFPGGLVISAYDLAKLTAVMANDGEYDGVRYLESETVEKMEEYLPGKIGVFYQALPMHYIQDVFGREGIYYHTGNAYGIFAAMSYDPQTGDGVVVITNGAKGKMSSHRIYAVCDDIFDAVYRETAD